MNLSDQLSLGDMLKKCEEIQNSLNGDKSRRVLFDFGGVRPTSIGSWRGIYAELALSYSKDNVDTPLPEFIALLSSSIGKSFDGYKGGAFYMDADTPVWVDNYGEYSNTAVIDVVDDGYHSVIITTGYRSS